MKRIALAIVLLAATRLNAQSLLQCNQYGCGSVFSSVNIQLTYPGGTKTINNATVFVKQLNWNSSFQVEVFNFSLYDFHTSCTRGSCTQMLSNQFALITFPNSSGPRPSGYTTLQFPNKSVTITKLSNNPPTLGVTIQ